MNTMTTRATLPNLPAEKSVTVTRSVIRLNGVRVTDAEMRVLRDIAARIKGEGK
jgi:hypothetical protein